MDPIYLLLLVPLVPWSFFMWLLIREARGEAASASSAAKSPARQKRAGTPRMMPMPAVLRIVGEGTLDVMGLN
jgi:hypothetical protein